MKKTKKREIIVEFRLKKEDYNALKNYYMYKRTPKRTKIMACLLIISFLLLALSGMSYALPFFKAVGLCGILSVVAVYSWVSIDARRLEKGVARFIGKKQETRLTEEGFCVKWKEIETEEEYPWTEANYIYEDDDYFFISLGSRSYVIIAKLDMKINRQEHRIKEIHDLTEERAKLFSELSR
jgi:hypothetical protein